MMRCRRDVYDNSFSSKSPLEQSTASSRRSKCLAFEFFTKDCVESRINLSSRVPGGGKTMDYAKEDRSADLLGS